VAIQQGQVCVVEMCDPKPPKHFGQINLMDGLGGGIGNLIQTIWCIDHMPGAHTGLPTDRLTTTPIMSTLMKVYEATSEIPAQYRKVKLLEILLETDCPDRRLKRHLVEVSVETVQQRRSPTKAKMPTTNRPATSARYECILLSPSRSDQLRLPRCLTKWTPRRFAGRV
jgi:hypothetical protein